MSHHKQMGPLTAMGVWVGINAFFALLVFTSQRMNGQRVNPPTGIDLNIAILVAVVAIAVSVIAVWFEETRENKRGSTQ